MSHSAIVPNEGVFIGRARVPGYAHPRVVTVRPDGVFDITSRVAPTVRDICEMTEPAGYVLRAETEFVGTLADLAANSWPGQTDETRRRCYRRSTCRPSRRRGSHSWCPCSNG